MKFSWEYLLYRNYTRSTSEPSALPLRVTAVVRFALCLEHLFYFCFLLHVELFFIFLTIVRSLDFARDDPMEGRAIRIASKKDFLLEVFLFLYLIISTTVVLILVCRQISGISSGLVLLFQQR